MAFGKQRPGDSSSVSPFIPERRRPFAQPYYFLFGASNATITPFINILFKRAGLSATHIGVIGALSPWLSAPSDWALGTLADRFGKHRAMFVVASITCVTSRAVVAVPELFSPSLLFWGMLAAAVVSYMMYNITVVLVDAAVVASLTNSRNYGRVRTWASAGWGISATIIGSVIDKYGFLCAWYANWVGSALALAIGTFVIPFDLLSVSDDKDDDLIVEGHEPEYNPEGGSGLTEPLLASHDAAQVPRVKLQSHEVHLPVNEVLASTAHDSVEPALTNLHGSRSGGIGSGLRIQMPIPVDVHDCVIATIDTLEELAATLPSELDDDDAGRSTIAGASAAMSDISHIVSAGRNLLEIACHPRAALFLALVFSWGAGFGVIESYLFLWLQELNASQKLMGLTLSLNCLAEVPIMFFSDRIIKRVGTDGCIHLVMAAMVLRLTAHSTLALWPSTWLVLPVELLHGVTFGLAWACGTVKSAQLAPPGMRAGMQGMFQAVYMGVGKGGGTLLAGLAYDAFGAAVMFRMAAACIACFWMAAFTLKTMMLKH